MGRITVADVEQTYGIPQDATRQAIVDGALPFRSGLDDEDVYRWVDSLRIHTIPTPDGPFVCRLAYGYLVWELPVGLSELGQAECVKLLQDTFGWDREISDDWPAECVRLLQETRLPKSWTQ